MPTGEPEFHTQSNLDFRLMSLTYKFRDVIKSRRSILSETGIKEGFQVLDYGCGPGGYIGPLAELVGKLGKIYALDIHPLAIKATQRVAAKKHLANVHTILSDCKTGLPPDSLDAILLYDILHDLRNAGEVLSELHRVLKPDGLLSVSDHHLKKDQLLSRITGGRLFKLLSVSRTTFSFLKN